MSSVGVNQVMKVCKFWLLHIILFFLLFELYSLSFVDLQLTFSYSVIASGLLAAILFD